MHNINIQYEIELCIVIQHYVASVIRVPLVLCAQRVVVGEVQNYTQ